jgi:hypothetical protein
LLRDAEIIQLQSATARAASRAPVKELARETGLKPREIAELREGRRVPHLSNVRKLTRHDPEYLCVVMRFLAGEIGTGDASDHSPSAIAEMVRALARPPEGKW